MDENTIAFAVLYGIIGGVSCFYGYRLLRVMLALVGFAAGVLLALSFLDLFVVETEADTLVSYARTIDELSAESSLVGLGVTLAVGIVAAILIQVFYRVGVFVLAGSGAAFITFALLSNNPDISGDLLLFLILFAFGAVGVFALRIERAVLVLSTASAGALLLIVSGYMILDSNGTAPDQPFGDDAVGVSVGVVLLFLWLIVAIAGAYKQFDDADTLLDGY